MKCYCCGEERDWRCWRSLPCHDEIKVCRVCVGWLMRRAGGVDVTPTLPVRDMGEATRFYEAAGFDVERYSDGFAFVHPRRPERVRPGPRRGHGPCDEPRRLLHHHRRRGRWHARLIAAGLHGQRIEDMPWGMHEFTLTDPSGNTIRIGRNS